MTSEAVLHEEVNRLPWGCRAAVVLCYFDGLSPEQAARQLGCPVGTVQSRLARGRERLRTRLTRRGLAPHSGRWMRGLPRRRPRRRRRPRWCRRRSGPRCRPRRRRRGLRER